MERGAARRPPPPLLLQSSELARLARVRGSARPCTQPRACAPPRRGYSDQDAREPPVKAVVVEAAEHGVLLDDQNAAARSAVGSDAQLAYERRVTRDLPHHLVEWLEPIPLLSNLPLRPHTPPSALCGQRRLSTCCLLQSGPPPRWLSGHWRMSQQAPQLNCTCSAPPPRWLASRTHVTCGRPNAWRLHTLIAASSRRARLLQPHRSMAASSQNHGSIESPRTAATASYAPRRRSPPQTGRRPEATSGDAVHGPDAAIIRCSIHPCTWSLQAQGSA